MRLYNFLLFRWLANPTSVNAYYIPVFNQICKAYNYNHLCVVDGFLPPTAILEAIMRTPAFSAEWPL